MNPTASHALRSTTCTNGLPRSFGPDGCPAVVDGSRRCGETKNLQIINEFKRLYEDKMKQIDDIAGGDCIQAKVNLQQEWIKDLTDQNEMLVRVVEELEVEAAERVTLLEKKLQQSAKSAGEKEDLVKEQEKRIKELEEQLKPFVENGKLPHDYAMLMREYKELEQSMLDMRDALTAEVADKHDTVLCLRREVHLLEEECRKADQQTHFKDDIIKELRKEIKQLKLQQTQHHNHHHQDRTSPDKSRTRSPKRRIQHSKSDADTTIDQLRDGTIVIRDSETIGDSLHTQTIKEKFSDPQNQTIVYICESVPHKSKHTGNKDVLSNSRDACEVTMDVPKISSRNNYTIDQPRNASNDVSLSTFQNASLISHSTIQETCIRYSRDILELLNRTSQMKDGHKIDKDSLKLEECSQSSNSLNSKNELDKNRSVELLYENAALKVANQNAKNDIQNLNKRNPLFKCNAKKVKDCICGNDGTVTSLLSRHNTKGKCEDSKEISFNENEIRAFSSPYPDSTPSQDVVEIKKLFRGDQGETPESRFLGSKRSFVIPNRQGQIFPEGKTRRPKPLSTRTLRKDPPSRCDDEISFSAKSQSLPSCKVAGSRYVRPPVIANYNYVDTHFMIAERRKRLALNLDTEKSCFCDRYIDNWSCFNNTY